MQVKRESLVAEDPTGAQGTCDVSGELSAPSYKVFSISGGSSRIVDILLKCVWGVKPGQPGPVSDYLNLRDYWRVTPWLESRLGDRIGKLLQRYE